MPTHRTDVEINAKTKGFSEAQQKATTLSKGAEKSLQKLVAKQSELSTAMEAMGKKGSKAYKAIAVELKAVDKEAAQVERTLGRLDRAFQRSDRQAKEASRKQEAGRGGFAQGLAQGAFPGTATFLQRGPGMRRQMGGMALGAGARRVGGGMAAMGGSMFTGAQGVAQGLRGIPFVGDALSGLMSTAMAQSKQALSFKQVQQGTLPYLGGAGLRPAMGAAAGKASAQSRAMGFMSPPSITQGAIDRRSESLADRERAKFTGAAKAGSYAAGKSAIAAGGLPAMPTGVGTQEIIASTHFRGPEAFRGTAESQLKTEAIERVAQRAGSAAAAAERVKRLGNIKGTGQRFGYSAPESYQMAGQISQVGGGVGGTMAKEGLLGTAMGAQRAFGVGADVSGAFLQASRTGGAVGAEGRSADAMAGAIGDAVNLGLSGSDLTDYMQQMSGDIRAWKDSGIPLNTQTISDMGQTFSQLGLGGVRGSRVGRAMTQAAQGVGVGGISGARDLAMLQELGGYDPEGGADSYLQARMRLEESDFQKGGVESMVKRFSAGGGAQGTLKLQAQFQGMGIKMKLRKVQEMQERVRSGQRVSLPESGMTGEGVAALGEAVTSSALKRQADIINKQIATGARLLTTMQNFEESTAIMSGAFTKLAAGPLQSFTNKMVDASSSAGRFAQHIADWMGEDVATSSGN